MSVKPGDIAAARDLRDEARAIVTKNFSEARSDLSPQTITKTIKNKASNEAMHLLDETRAVVAENKFVIGGTIVALTAWFAKKPLIVALRRVPLPRKLVPKKLERLWP
ncbi:hypothetical protein [Novosphingobium sp.]|uniref:hypothetical protein n=1 Tax=Novosphingobium sp. TaxID=1874826 RepID=UPI0025DDCC56|nr:hypothetical protein [Novosphingobium sp.]